MFIYNFVFLTYNILKKNIYFIVQTETKPKSVHLWHANTFWNNRRDFRIANLDNPCLSGPIVSIGGYDNLCGNLFVLWTAEVGIYFT